MPTLPDRGSPLDLSYILTMANEINDINAIVRLQSRNMSNIKYPTNPPRSVETATSNLTFYASANTLSPKFSTQSDLITRFNFNFSSAPIVTASVQVVSGEAPPIFAVITNLNSNGCDVKLFSSGTVTGDPVVNVSIIAIGERP
jgi:hypothetical protein